MDDQKETPGAGQRTGGKGEHDNHHPDIIAPNIADLSQRGEPDRLLDEAVAFLMDWCRDGPWVLTSIVPDGGTTTETFHATDASIAQMRTWIGARLGKQNIYFTVNRTYGDVESKPNKGAIAAIRAVHVDVDPRPGEDVGAERARAVCKLREYHPPPTVIIDSGGGMQGFWLSEDEADVGGSAELAHLFWRDAKPEVRGPLTETERAEVNAHKSRLAATVEGRNLKVEVSLQADACHNADRIMRLPGTVNVPNKKKRGRGRVPTVTSVFEAEWSRRYPLEAFPDVELPKRGDFNGNSVELPADLPKVELEKLQISDRCRMLIVNGDDPDDPTKYPSRSEVLFAVLCEMVRAECSDEQMAAVILDREFEISAHVHEQPNTEGYAARQIGRARAEAVEPELAEMNARHAMVKYGGRVRVLVERSDGLPEFLKKTEFFDWYANRTVKVAEDKDKNDVKKPLAEWWMKHPQRRDFERVEFMPGAETPEGVYNLWRGPAVVPAPGDCCLFLDLIRDVIAAGDSEVYEYLLNWMALKFQQPGAKLETSIALRGGQGVGKSLFAEKFGELFGRHFVAVSDQRGLMGNFNAHLQQALLVFADEIAAATSTNMVGRLKTLLTQTHIRIEPKGVDSFSAPNHFAVILASNNPHIVATDADDRRWLVLDVSPSRRSDRVFFHALVEQWEGGGCEAFAHLLMQRDLSGFEHRDRPQTAALAEQVESSFTGAARVIHEMLASGETPEIWRNGVTVDVPDDGGRVFIPSGALAKAAIASGKIQRGEAAGLEKSLGHQLKRLGRVQKTDRISIAGKTARGVWLPPLATAREWWSQMHGRDFDWGDDAQAEWDVVPVPTAETWGDEMPF
ncbi:MAG: primase-helicase family protein [Pseudomonadota bacterium]